MIAARLGVRSDSYKNSRMMEVPGIHAVHSDSVGAAIMGLKFGDGVVDTAGMKPSSVTPIWLFAS